jgi:hypothetical protein
MQTVTVEDQTSAVVVSAHHLGECGLAWNPSPLVAGEAPPPYLSPRGPMYLSGPVQSAQVDIRLMFPQRRIGKS